MTPKPERIKWSKKEKALAVLHLKSYPGQIVTCIPVNNKPSDWIFLTVIDSRISCISGSLAGILEMQFANGVLRGPKYSSPFQILANLQTFLNFDKPFVLEVLNDSREEN